MITNTTTTFLVVFCMYRNRVLLEVNCIIISNSVVLLLSLQDQSIKVEILGLGDFLSALIPCTLGSEINVWSGINIGVGRFEKKQ